MLIEAASPDGSKGYLPFLKGRVSGNQILVFSPHGFASRHVDIFQHSFHNMRLYVYGFLGEAVTAADMEADS